MKRSSDKRFESRILLKTKNKRFFAEKVDKTYRKSLEKSYLAIKRQLEKSKINKVHKHHSEMIFEESILEKQVA
jgi:hypothetical protein